jgi:hypothetical protein
MVFLHRDAGISRPSSHHVATAGARAWQLVLVAVLNELGRNGSTYTFKSAKPAIGVVRPSSKPLGHAMNVTRRMRARSCPTRIQRTPAVTIWTRNTAVQVVYDGHRLLAQNQQLT